MSGGTLGHMGREAGRVIHNAEHAAEGTIHGAVNTVSEVSIQSVLQEIQKGIQNLTPNEFDVVNKVADQKVDDYRRDHPDSSDYCDCVDVVAAACVGASYYYGGLYAAALAYEEGRPLARLACTSRFQRQSCAHDDDPAIRV